MPETAKSWKFKGCFWKQKNRLPEGMECAILCKRSVVLQGGKPPKLHKKMGGGAYEYIRSFNIVKPLRYVSRCTIM